MKLEPEVTVCSQFVAMAAGIELEQEVTVVGTLAVIMAISCGHTFNAKLANHSAASLTLSTRMATYITTHHWTPLIYRHRHYRVTAMTVHTLGASKWIEGLPTTPMAVTQDGDTARWSFADNWSIGC